MRVKFWLEGGEPAAPCPGCLMAQRRFGIRRETVRPLSAVAAINPISRYTSEAVCHDCALAEGLMDRQGLTWEQARIAVSNDRAESLRLPGAKLGHMGLAAPHLLCSDAAELKEVWEWLARIGLE